MTDHTAGPDHSTVPDYALPETLELTEPAQYRALFEKTRLSIIDMLLERAATTTDMAAALGKPKGTVGYHLKILAEAGLVQVVRTERVRALEARYYGRTARTFLYHKIGEDSAWSDRMLAEADAEYQAAEAAGDDLPSLKVLRYARIPKDRAADWEHRLRELLTDFVREPRGGDVSYGLLVAFYPTDRPRLPDPKEGR
ncbi:MAG: ArsR family transcriptional regulator [Jiangellaceae bacterium]